MMVKPKEIMQDGYKDYGFRTEAASHMHRRFMPVVLDFAKPLNPGMRVLDVGCGNGFACGVFLKHGCKVVGIDLSNSGIEIARKSHSGGRFEVLVADDKILDILKEPPFDLVFSSEVVEHLYAPRPFAKGCFSALKAVGRLILTTPYHSYLKNLAISLSGGWDRHANPLWDGGHKTLESPNNHPTVGGNWFQKRAHSWRGTHPRVVDDDGGCSR